MATRRALNSVIPGSSPGSGMRIVMNRYSIELGDAIVGLLEVQANKGNCNKGEVIRRALASYAYLKDHMRDDGHKLALIDSNDNIVKEIILP